MLDVAGSIRKVTLDGVTYDTPADANFSEIGSAYENKAVPTSGRNMRQMIKRVQVVENVVLLVNGAEREQLRALAERTDDFPMSYQTAAGDTYRASGWIELEKRETEEGKATLKLFPRTTWEAFLAS